MNAASLDQGFRLVDDDLPDKFVGTYNLCMYFTCLTGEGNRSGPGGGDVPAAVAGAARAGRGAGAGGGRRAAAPRRVARQDRARAHARRRRPRRLLRGPLGRAHQPLPDAHARAHAGAALNLSSTRGAIVAGGASKISRCSSSCRRYWI